MGVGVEVSVDWGGAPGMAFVATTGSGHMLCMDGAPEGGGNNLAPRPMELVLAGAGGCAAYDVVLILRKSGQAIERCEVKLHAERAAVDPKVFTRIVFHFVITGRGVSANLVERALKLSHDKYCSASAMLGKTAELEFTYALNDNALSDTAGTAT